MNFIPGAFRRPIYLLLALLFLAGLLVFRDYGLTWDEPLFYGYADALGYAYTPTNWFSGHFDLNQSYGPSASDHKNRGPAYLLLAREPVYLLEHLGLEAASAWHLLNLLSFLVAVYFVYRLCTIFARDWAAVAAAALFGMQPSLWGYAFINPKDVPFMAFLTGSVWLGFRMVDRLSDRTPMPTRMILVEVLLPAFFLGITTSIRVLGPLAGLLVVLYFLAGQPSWRAARWMMLYLVLSVLFILATWPYLWESPLRFLQVFRFMSDNPTVLPVLFADQVYPAYDLPRRYLPFFLAFTVTEPVWPLVLGGLAAAAHTLRRHSRKLVIGLLMLIWFAIPVAYGIVFRPPLYDGMRHFLFVLPPLFVFVAMAVEALFLRIGNRWANIALASLVLAPGLLGSLRLHPYEYAYYNAFIGGTGGAFRHYETDYWLTCYREAVRAFDGTVQKPVTLYVHREAPVAAPYASADVTVRDQRGAGDEIKSGDYILVNTRTNEDRQVYRDAPITLTVGRAGAIFCVVKSIP